MNKPGVAYYRALLHLIGYIKGIPEKYLKFYSDIKKAQIYKTLIRNNITLNEDTTSTFTDSSWKAHVGDLPHCSKLFKGIRLEPVQSEW